MSLKDATCIVGIGETPVGKVPGRSPLSFEAEAALNAIRDAGLRKEDIDGLLCRTPTDHPVFDYCTVLAHRLGLQPTFMADIGTMGATPTSMVQLAAMAIYAGQANCVLGLIGRSQWSREGHRAGSPGGDQRDYQNPYGHLGAPAGYAMAARRHMHEYGTTNRHLAAVAVVTRKHASLNPNAQMRTPITVEDVLNSRWIAEPFHLLDCCVQSDGGAAFIVTSAARAKSLRKPPVSIMGMGQHYPYGDLANAPSMTTVGSKISSERAYAVAGVGPDDIDVAEIYDCFTYTTLVTLEDYGFCKKGEGGPFVESGAIELGGKIPTNTHGGLLSQAHLEAALHIVEAVKQLRREVHPAERQVKDCEIAIVSGNGGILQTHNTLILRR